MFYVAGDNSKRGLLFTDYPLNCLPPCLPACLHLAEFLYIYYVKVQEVYITTLLKLSRGTLKLLLKVVKKSSCIQHFFRVHFYDKKMTASL
jgi:hypothetical protein